MSTFIHREVPLPITDQLIATITLVLPSELDRILVLDTDFRKDSKSARFENVPLKFLAVFFIHSVYGSESAIKTNAY